MYSEETYGAQSICRRYPLEFIYLDIELFPNPGETDRDRCDVGNLDKRKLRNEESFEDLDLSTYIDDVRRGAYQNYANRPQSASRRRWKLRRQYLSGFSVGLGRTNSLLFMINQKALCCHRMILATGPSDRDHLSKLAAASLAAMGVHLCHAAFRLGPGNPLLLRSATSCTGRRKFDFGTPQDDSAI
jgi:hypothetical protein